MISFFSLKALLYQESFFYFLMNLNRKILCFGAILVVFIFNYDLNAQTKDSNITIASSPLFNDPIHDGAADPVLIWNRQEKSWWMLYTARRANMPTPDVSGYYGNKIGVASSDDHGKTWPFRGYLDLEFERGWNTFWAPDVVYDNGKYHMFVVYIKGVRNHWEGEAKILYYTSENLWDWSYQNVLKLSSDRVIDASLFKTKKGIWKMWYKDNSNKGNIMMSESSDLVNWNTSKKPTIPGGAQEGPKIFEFKGYYWMLADEWQGMRIYRSKDLEIWEKQGLILDSASNRKDDGPSGAHGDVLVFDDIAYIFYFTHPGRKSHLKTEASNSFYDNHRTAIQVAPLTFEGGTLKSNREEPFNYWLPEGK
tara:strand:- start:9769 stop:10863 length:1095 start_codon:yes stop_codon:yes gene_type:complete